MTESTVTVLLYWDCEMLCGINGPYFNKGPNDSIELKHNATYHEFMDEVYEALEVDKSQVKVKMTCRFPVLVSDREPKYVPLHIKNNKNCLSMVNVVLKNHSITSIDLYIEKEQIVVANQASEHVNYEGGSCRGSTPLRDSPPPPIIVQPSLASPTTETAFNSPAMNVVQQMLDTESDAWVDRGMDANLTPDNSDDDINVDELGLDDIDENEPSGPSLTNPELDHRMHEPPAPHFTTFDESAPAGEGSFSTGMSMNAWHPTRHEISKSLRFRDKSKIEG